jgi:flagellar basal body P-ring formation protein FlgA
MVRATFDVPHALRRIVARHAATWLACAVASVFCATPVLAQDSASGPIVIPGPGQQNSDDLARMTAMATSGAGSQHKTANSAAALATIAPAKPTETDRFSALADKSGAIVIPGTAEPAAPATPHWISTAPNTPPGAGLTRVNMNAALAASQVMPVVVNPTPARAMNAAVNVAVNPTAERPVDTAPAGGSVEIDSLASRGEPPELGASAASRNPAPAANSALTKLPAAPAQMTPQALAEAAQRAQAIEAAMGQGQGARGFNAATAQAGQAAQSAQTAQAEQTAQAIQALQAAQARQLAQAVQAHQAASANRLNQPAQAVQAIPAVQAAQTTRVMPPVPAYQATQPVQYAQPAQAAQPVPAGQEDGELIHAAALEFLKQQVNGLPGHVELTVAPAFPRGLAACATLQPFLPNGARLWGRTTVGVRCTSGHPWTVWLQARVSINATYYVAARAMNPGEVVTEADLISRDGDLTMLPMSIITSPSQAVGSVTLMRVGQGLPLRQDMLKNAQQVTAGQTVQVVAQGDGFQISSEGSALSNAQPGQPVKVKTAAGQIVMGIVKNSSTVQIQM